MDPVAINNLMTEASRAGLTVLLLLSAVIYLIRRDRTSDARTDARVKQEREDAIAREQASREQCMDREHELSERLRVLEDRQYSENAKIMDKCANALVDNAAAFRAIAETPSGLHRLVSGPRTS